jgi:hypothetical protein
MSAATVSSLIKGAAGPKGGALGKAQLFRAIQKGFGNAYAQTVLRAYESPSGKKPARGGPGGSAPGKEGAGSKAGASGKEAPPEKDAVPTKAAAPSKEAAPAKDGAPGKAAAGKEPPPAEDMARLLREEESAELRMASSHRLLTKRPAAEAPKPSLAKQKGLGIARAASGPGLALAPAGLRVSSPDDPAEREAAATARKIVGMAAPAPTGISRAAHAAPAPRSAALARFAPAHLRLAATTTVPEIQRRSAGPAATGANVGAEIQGSQSGGAPLPPSVRGFMEPRFRANFGNVRVHTGDKAANLSRQVSAQAFTVGNQIFFGKDRFRPETSEGKELIAHELTHTIQQGAAAQGAPPVQRSEDVTVTQHATPHVQRLSIIGEALDYIADKAKIIPGFRMFTIIIGVNPINMEPVDRSAANILRALVEFMPGGGLITEALDNYGVFEKAGAFIEQQIAALGISGSAIAQAVKNFVKGLGITDLGRLGQKWEEAKAIFTGPIDKLIQFAKNVVVAILEMIKDAIIRPIAKLAQGLPSYDLLKAVMGKDPITGDPYPPTAENIIGPFMKLIGQDEVWENMKKANAISRAFAWVQGAIGAVKAFVLEIPPTFMAALKALQISDIVQLPTAFSKIVGIFGNFLGRFVSWAGDAVWNLLEIIFDSVSPGAFGYVKKTGAALKSILKDPLPFVGNLVKAAKLGFQNFGANFGTHLKAGLIEWLTGSLPGVYIPKSFAIGEIIKFVFSVLGLSWANVRIKLVAAVGEPVVKAMEIGFSIVKTLVTQGPAAAWEQIKSELSNLKDMVISGIIDLVVDIVVQKAVPKLIAMFIPGAGFISAIISIYDTVMVFVQKISKIIQVVTAFIDSIVAIAGGAIGAAAAKVESILAGLLSLAISFLAGFAGGGKIADKVMGVIKKVRGVIDKGLDALIKWIVTMAKKLFAKVFPKKEDKGKPGSAVKAKVAAELSGKQLKDSEEEKTLAASVYGKFKGEGLKGIRFKPGKGGALDVIVSASLAEKVAQLNLKTPEGLKELSRIAGMMSPWAGTTTIVVFYGEAHKQFKKIGQKRGKAGHAEHWLMTEGPALMQRIRREYKTQKVPLAAPVPVHLDINRTPCDGCSESHLQKVINQAKSAYPDVQISLTISAASVSAGAQITTEQGIAALMARDVEITASMVWTEIKKQMKANGIKTIVYRGRHYDMDDVNEFIADAKEVQQLIDKTVASVKKGKPKPVVQGSGA